MYDKFKQYSLVITRADNGYIVREVNGSGNPLTIVEEHEVEDGEASATQDLLQVINEKIGHVGSRYDKKRVYVILRPGDKNEAFTNMDAEVIWGDPKDPDLALYGVDDDEDSTEGIEEA